jgi:CRP-like cAMP-binding protein
MKTPRSFYDSLNFIEGLSEPVRRDLLEDAMLIELKNRSILFSQDEPAEAFFVVLSGVIKLTRMQEEATTLLDLVSATEMIGSILMQEEVILNYPVSAISMGESEVLRVPREIFLKSWVTNPAVNQLIQKQIHRRMTAFQQDRCMQRQSLEKRVAYFVVQRLQHLENLSITRQEIADAIGTTSESVIRVLSLWEEKEWISSRSHQIKLLKPEEIYRLWRAPA